MDPNSRDVAESTPTGSTRWDSSWPEWISPSERDPHLSYFEDRFGIDPRTFENYRWWRTEDAWGVVKESGHLPVVASLRVSSVGMVLLRRVSRYIKPTTTAVQVFGRFARRNVVDLDGAALRALVGGVPLSPVPSGLADPGYVILTYRGEPLGCGLVVDERLLNQLPRWLTGPLAVSFARGG